MCNDDRGKNELRGSWWRKRNALASSSMDGHARRAFPALVAELVAGAGGQRAVQVGRRTGPPADMATARPRTVSATAARRCVRPARDQAHRTTVPVLTSGNSALAKKWVPASPGMLVGALLPEEPGTAPPRDVRGCPLDSLAIPDIPQTTWTCSSALPTPTWARRTARIRGLAAPSAPINVGRDRPS